LSPTEHNHNEQEKSLRERLIVTDFLKKDQDFIQSEQRRILNRIRWITASVALILSVVGVFLFFLYNTKLSTYSVDDEWTVSGMNNGSMYLFKDGNLLIGTDSVTYWKNGKIQWTTPISLNHPVCKMSDNYFALYDIGNYDFCIFDETGMLSTTKVSREIYNLDIADSGVTAVFTESSDAAYISYFDRFGTKVDVELKTVLASTGYPVDMAISPNGQELLVLYYSTENGIGESTMHFYDFANGKEEDSFLIEKYTDFYDTDTYLAFCDFATNKDAVVVGDNQIFFLNYEEKKGLTRTSVEIREDPLSFICEEDYFALITGSSSDAKITLYQYDGTVNTSYAVPGEYDNIVTTNTAIFFFDGPSVQIYNASGRFRYSGTLVASPVAVAPVRNNTILVNYGSKITKLTFK